MKKISLLLVSFLSAFAVDYTAMSLEELQAARGTVAEVDRSAFSAEMQARMQALTPEERAVATSTMRQSKSGAQDGSGTQLRQGGGQGTMSGSTMGTKTQRRSGR